MDRIFVQIASYRDRELPRTINSLFEQADHPERVFVGICLQVVPGADAGCEPMASRPAQVRCARYPAGGSRGACWARAVAQQLWEGEEFTLQIDSHTRFARGWDTGLLDTLAACPSEKAVLSTYPPHYFPPDICHHGYITLLLPAQFDEEGILLLSALGVPLEHSPSAPVLGAFCGGCLLFGPAQIIADVPYDPHLYFLGEEISLAVRLWTHGWDIYHPNVTLVYHLWQREYRPKHWDDLTKWAELDAASRRRVRHQLAMEPSGDPAVLVDLDRYGLGSLRSLRDYEQFSGLDFAGRQIGSYDCWAGRLQREWQTRWAAARRRDDLW